MSQKTLIQRIDDLEALGRAVISEAIEMRKSLSPVQARTTRKGLTTEQRANLVSRRNKIAFAKPNRSL